jgi:hypothetical protein
MASNNGGEGSIPPRSSLQFVNMTPATQSEKQRNQKVVRSAAMKTFRRNQKLQRMKENESSTSNRVIARKPQEELIEESIQKSNSEAISSEVCWPGSQSPSQASASSDMLGFAESDLGGALASQSMYTRGSQAGFLISRETFRCVRHPPSLIANSRSS